MGLISLLLWLAFLLLSTTLVAGERKAPVLHFEVPVRRSSEMVKGIREAMSKSLQKQGYDLEVEDLPTKRGVEELKKGRLDGTLGRFGDIARVHGIKGYTRIDYPVVLLTYTLWCNEKPSDFDKKAAIRLGYHRGAMSIAKLMDAITNQQVELQDIIDYHVAVSMLKRKRLDCIVGPGAYMEAELDVERELAGTYQHNLVTLRAYAWIRDALAPLVKGLEKDLAEYPYDAVWLRKYRSEKATCRNRFDTLCPDGVIFTKEVDLLQ